MSRTNKIRTQVEANFQKVQLQNRQANTNFLLSSINCKPDYNIINYVETCKKCSNLIIPIPTGCFIYDGGSSTDNFPLILDGTGGMTLDGNCDRGNVLLCFIYDGGSSTDNFPLILDGNGSKTTGITLDGNCGRGDILLCILLEGGTSTNSFPLILDGIGGLIVDGNC